MNTTREAYKKWGADVGKIVSNLLREPTSDERAALMPAFQGILPEHTIKHVDGSPLTVGDYLDFTTKAWRAKQKAELIKMLRAEHIDPFDFVKPCEPDCTSERHAYHQGQWDMANRIKEKQEVNHV